MGVIVLLAEQNMHFCLGNASQAVIIDKCHVIYRDSNETLKADNEVRSRYLTV
jgi:branched-chain amino acid transport system ATP-binding protein